MNEETKSTSSISEKSTSSISEEAKPAPPPKEPPPPLNGGVFIGARPPVWSLEHEQPWHRMAAEFFAFGDTARGVARKMGKSQPAVLNLLRQPWFMKMVTQRMAETGQRQDIFKIFQNEQFNNYCTLVELRDNPATPAAIKERVATGMLDRSMGKPTQRVEMSHETFSSDPVEEVQKLEEENRRLREELDLTNDSSRKPAEASGRTA